MQYGYFDNANREYVITRPDVPTSWTNYLGLENMCTVVSHNAGGYSFYKSAQRGRITRFRPNAVPLDRPGHYVYVRDDDTGKYWSVSWQPVGKSLNKAKYMCRHGLSYSSFCCRYNGIGAEQTLFIPLGDDVELWDVVLANKSKRVRHLSVFSYVEFSLHNVILDNQDFQMGLYASGSSYKNGIIDYDFFYAPGLHYFFTASFEPDSYDCLRDSFIGPYRTETNPLAVELGKCSLRSQLGSNHCGSLHKRYTIKPGQSARCVFMLGVGSREKQGRHIRKKYSNLANVDQAFAALRQHWRDKLSILQCVTPDSDMNTMINTWTLYQAETCVTWSRFASFIEVGGRTGLGYRDTAQDTMSVGHTNPAKVRQRILELLHAQVSTGFGLHLFDPLLLPPEQVDNNLETTLPTVVIGDDSADKVRIPTLKDVCSDDALWLVVAVCEYIKETGKADFFDRLVPFADKGQATVYEHLKRALDFSAGHVGPHGIAEGLRADWNDCINLRGGESAMVSFIHYWALQVFIEAAEHLGRQKDVRKYERMARKIKAACDDFLWDGQWYIRGFTAAGRKIGTRKDRQGKVFLNAQSWAVMSGLSTGQRAKQCLDAVNKHLFSKYGLHLLWPSYGTPDDDIGFVTRVYKGIKENAAIFSHPNPWAIIAECMLGRGDRAIKYYNAMLPCRQNDIIEIRQAEPYSYCQFVMGKDHTRHGQARHPWLTGSAGWFYIAATQWIMGIRPTLRGLVVDPCIPKKWKDFHVTRKWLGATYCIAVLNPFSVSKGVASVELNGQSVSGPIPPQQKGSVNQVVVTMGHTP
jgi:N,N'-diacetylchitobiose phosphorylase